MHVMEGIKEARPEDSQDRWAVVISFLVEG